MSYVIPVDLKCLVSQIIHLAETANRRKIDKTFNEVLAIVRLDTFAKQLGKYEKASIALGDWTIYASRQDRGNTPEPHIHLFAMAGSNFYPVTIHLHNSQLSFLDNGGSGFVDQQNGETFTETLAGVI